jgi:hypothetical protein|tara:strand:- start:348 stop:461 length:114 start_codon:yes stop_codon:yes gene_type:complete
MKRHLIRHALAALEAAAFMAILAAGIVAAMAWQEVLK